VRILVVEDDEDLRQSVTTALKEAGHVVEVAADGLAADERIAEGGLDAIVLDWMLPGMNGVEVCRRARDAGSAAAIIMLTARDDVDDRVRGLDSGADDYVVKPFSVAELLARVRSIARRASSQRRAIYTAGPVQLDVAARIVTVDQRPVGLSSREFDLLELLVRNCGNVMTRGDIEEHVWGARFSGTSNVVDVFVRRVRRKLGDGASVIETVRGVGYRVGKG
jgi:two-component system, OmpR family, response regulator